MSARSSALTASFRAHSERGMAALGHALGLALESALAGQPSLLLGLDGELGAGKTTLAAATLKALGVHARITSPTYGLVHPYTVDLNDSGAAVDVLHVDLYRLQQAVELDELDLIADASTTPGAGGQLLLVEWLENARGRLGAPDVGLFLRHAEPGRLVTARGNSRAGRQIVNLLRTARHRELILNGE